MLRHFLATLATGIALAGAAQAGTVGLSDGDFDPATWATTFASGVSGQTGAQVASGGNPGAYWEVETTTNTQTFMAHLGSALVYDPALGALDSIDISLQYLPLAARGDGHFIAPLLRQDGTLYRASGSVTGSTATTWQTYALTGLTPANFAVVSAAGINGAGAPDFSQAGAPITFGFLTGNSGGDGITIAYDNYAVSLHTDMAPIPLPAGIVLLGGGLALLPVLRRRR